MCGRYTQAMDPEALLARFGIEDPAGLLKVRYNLAPGQYLPVIVSTPQGHKLASMRWGLVPHWAKDQTIGNKMINARAETVAQKPSFREPLTGSRCLVPADGFYEWTRKGKAKRPMRFVMKDRTPFAFAGLWSRWNDPGGKALFTFTIVTTEANALLRRYHDRMPVILTPDAEPRWLNPSVRDPRVLLELLRPYSAAAMEGYEVSTRVNTPANDTPECIQPVGDSLEF